MSNEPGRWKLSDLKRFIDDGDGPVGDELSKIATLLEEEESSNFIFGKVIIENDLINDDDKESDDD